MLGFTVLMNDDGLIERVLSFTEKTRVGIIGAFSIVFLFAFLRSIMESSLFNYAGDGLYLRANHVALDFALFITGALIIMAISGLPGRKVFNVVLFGWFVILLPPIIDYFIGYTSGGYPYLSEPDFILALKRLLFMDKEHLAKAGWGEYVQLWSIIIMSSLYVSLRKKSVIRGFFTGVGLLLFMAFIYSFMPFVLSIGDAGDSFILFQKFEFPMYIKYYSGLTRAQAEFFIFQQLFLFVALYYTILFSISSIIFLYICSKERVKYFFKSVKWERVSLVAFLTLLGTYLSGVLYPEYIMHQVYMGFAIISTVSATQFWNMQEDLTKDMWDAPYTRQQYRNVSYAFAIVSLMTAYLLGTSPFILIITFLFLSYVFSNPPFSGKDSPFKSIMMGMVGVLSFLIGHYTPAYWYVVIWGPDPLHYDPSMVETIRVYIAHPFSIYSQIALVLSFLIFFFLDTLARKRRSEAES